MTSTRRLLHIPAQRHPMSLCQPRRSAMTLVEVVVVVTLSTLVMGVLISLTVALKQRDRAQRAFDVQCRRRSELAERLRTDIRRAIDVSLPAEKILRVTTAGGGQIHYELTTAGCNRSVTWPAAASPRVDFFAVGPAASWTLENGPTGRRPLFVATLHYADLRSSGVSDHAPLQVYAALGADLPSFLSSAHTE